MTYIADLRSDTVTTPTKAMWQAMMDAPVGDDVLGDDPTVHKLEALAAETVGMEAAVFVPSGTMGNQIAIAAHTRPGDSILVEDEAHVLYYEVGAPAVLNGLIVRSLRSEQGIVSPAEVRSRYLAKSLHTPGTTLLCLENTHNREGGTITPVKQHADLMQAALDLGIKIHLDGARVFNASVALGVDVREITTKVDSVSFCLSKGLGAPVGSVLCGTAAHIEEARVWRKRLGGGMRQAGLLAAAGIYALENNIGLLAADHRRAKFFADSLIGSPGLTPVAPQTNIVMVDTTSPADTLAQALEDAGIGAFAVGPNRLRFVFHHQVTDLATEAAIEAARRIVS